MSVEDRIESAFAEETFTIPIADVRRRRRPPLLRHNGLLVAALVVIGVVVAIAAWPGRSGQSASALDSDCRRQWASQPDPMPPFLVGAGDRGGIRVYAAGSTVFYCTPSAPGPLGGDRNSSQVLRTPIGTDAEVMAYAVDGQQTIYAGQAPEGTDRVEMSGDGRVWPARLAGGHFAVAIPAGIAWSYNIYLSTHGSYGVAVVQGPVLHSTPPPQFGAEACVASTAQLAEVPMLAAFDPPASPTLKVRLLAKAPEGYVPSEADLIAAPGILAVCRDGGAYAYFKAPDDDQFTAYGPVWSGGWAVGGRVPAGTTSVTVTLHDGTTRPATVAGGYWLAWDSPDETGPARPDPVPPRSAVAATPSGPVTVQITR